MSHNFLLNYYVRIDHIAAVINYVREARNMDNNRIENYSSFLFNICDFIGVAGYLEFRYVYRDRKTVSQAINGFSTLFLTKIRTFKVFSYL